MEGIWGDWCKYGNLTVDKRKIVLKEKETANIESVKEKAKKEKAAIGTDLNSLIAQRNAGDITQNEFNDRVASLATNIIST